MRRSLRQALSMVMLVSTVLAAVGTSAVGASARGQPSASGFFDGVVTDGVTGLASVASAVLNQTKKRIDGTVTMAQSGEGAASYAVRGSVRGRRLKLRGTSDGGATLKWRGKWKGRTAIRGKLTLRGAGGSVRHGMLTLVPRSTAPDACEAYFRDTVMAEVLVPVCAQCHVPGGLAELSNFRVSVDDPAATRQSVARLIDLTTPAASPLLQKPIGALGHGGGIQLAADGPQHLVLQEWVAKVAGGECSAEPPGQGGGGGGSGGGDGSGVTLYAASCASCHGADARGLDGRPDIHCHKSIYDSVRNGRTGALGDMPPFPNLTDADIAAIQGYLETLCPAGAATGAELFASNCATCHGATGSGGRNGAGVRGPDIRCTESHDFFEKVMNGDDEMPAFPELDAEAISRIVGFVHGFCSDGGSDDGDD